jgi:hypothetical protein
MKTWRQAPRGRELVVFQADDLHQVEDVPPVTRLEGKAPAGLRRGKKGEPAGFAG